MKEFKSFKHLNFEFKNFRVSFMGDGSEYTRKADSVQQDVTIQNYKIKQVFPPCIALY
jgi:hypothetical protein